MSQPVDDDLLCFDFDGTLTSTNALHQLCIIKYFYYPQVIRQLWVFIFILQIPVFYYFYKTSSQQFNRFLYSRYAGMRLDKLLMIRDQYLVRYISARIFPEADRIIRAAKRQSQRVVIVSASWDLVVTAVAEYLGVDHCLATQLEIINGRLTGRVLKLIDADQKPAVLREYLSAIHVVPKSIIAYGDSRHDLPLLNFSDQSFLINPSRSLRALAPLRATSLNWSLPSVHWTARLFALLVNRMLKSCEDIEHIPKTGACIVIANHTSYLDHLVLYTAIALFVRRRAKFVSKKEHFNHPWVAKIISYLGAYPIDREAGGRSALVKTIDLLNQNQIVVIYPEGTRSRDGKLKDFKTGVVLLQEKTQCPIVPVAIQGAFEIWPATKSWPKWGRVSLRVGQLIYPSLAADNLPYQQAQVERSQELKNQLSLLL
jgi:1-acyl-sn-glycerol-3-phosphate acyltransferase